MQNVQKKERVPNGDVQIIPVGMLYMVRFKRDTRKGLGAFSTKVVAISLGYALISFGLKYRVTQYSILIWSQHSLALVCKDCLR